MVAASFPNLSFENPPGTGPTLVSTVAEPFALVDGTSLTVTFAGATTSVVFLESDFADITAATAVEVGALLTLRIDDLTADDDGGFVRLISDLTGEDVSLQVQAGGVNDVLLFSTLEVTGQTYAGGPPNGWSVTTDNYLVNEHAEFADENGRPEETFDIGGWATVTITQTLAAAIFDTAFIPTPFETFTNWAPTGVLTDVPTEQATFDSGATLFEDFEDEWGSPTYFEFLAVHLDVQFAEDFETGWNQGASALSGPETFENDGGNLFESFEGFLPQTINIEIVTASGGDWLVYVNGVAHRVTMGMGASEDLTATDIASMIDGINGLNALGVFENVQITPDDYDAAWVVSVNPPAGGVANVQDVKDLDTSFDNWTGNDFNPDFD